MIARPCCGPVWRKARLSIVSSPLTAWRCTCATRVSAPGSSAEGCSTACTLTPGTSCASNSQRSMVALSIGCRSVRWLRKRSTCTPAGPISPSSFTSAMRPSTMLNRRSPDGPTVAATVVSTKPSPRYSVTSAVRAASIRSTGVAGPTSPAVSAFSRVELKAVAPAIDTLRIGTATAGAAAGVAGCVNSVPGATRGGAGGKMRGMGEPCGTALPVNGASTRCAPALGQPACRPLRQPGQCAAMRGETSRQIA